MLNPTFLLPYLFVPQVNILLGYFAIKWGVIPNLNGLFVGTATPSIIAVLFQGGGILGFLFVAFLILLDAALWYPFFKVQDNVYYQQEMESAEKE